MNRLIVLVFSSVTFLFISLSVASAQVVSVALPGVSIPEGVLDGVVVRVGSFNFNNPPENVYVVLNNDFKKPGYSNVGDVLEIFNPQTGKKFIFDSHCSTIKMPPVNLRNLLDPDVFERTGSQWLHFSVINKCPNSKDVDTLYALFFVPPDDITPFLPVMINMGTDPSTPSVTLTPTPPQNTNFVDFKQTDPQWSSARLDDSKNCGTLYGFGCAITSVANVFYSYGKTLLQSTQLNPGTLNSWMANNSGYASCGIIWAHASPAVNLGAPLVLFRNNSSDWLVGKEAIENALAEGHLPIIGVKTNNNSAGTHFFVVSSRLPDVNGKPDYKIIDPALYPFVANRPGNTGKSLSETYGGFDKVFETVIYKKGSSPQKTLSIRAHSPVQLLITDPLGNQTGYDEGTQSINENIPDSAYGLESGIAPVDGSSPASGETKYFQQIDPTDGEYAVQLIGTGNGSYTLDVSKTDEQGNVSTEIVEGFAQTGVTETYHIEYTSDATEKPIINKEVTFDILKSDLKNLYAQGKIKNKLVYSTLKFQVELAERATQMNRQPLGNKLAVIPLKTFILELNKVRGKYVTEDAYQILYKDVTALIKSLQGGTSTEPTPTPGNGGS